MRRGILPIVGSTVVGLRLPKCALKPIKIDPYPNQFRKRVVGRKIESTSRLGKRVLVNLNSSESIIFEPRMTGLVLLVDPPGTEHLRFELQLDHPLHPSLLYWDRRGLGNVTLLTLGQIRKKLEEGSLGPDALEVDAHLMKLRLGNSRRAIKVALLDQRAVAGIGNLYASEILHLAKLHPQKPCNRLRKTEWCRLAEMTRFVLNEAISYEGSTLSDGTYRNALNKSGGYQNHHRVYDCKDKPCLTCQTPIQRIVQAQRSTFFCPKCQRAVRGTK